MRLLVCSLLLAISCLVLPHVATADDPSQPGTIATARQVLLLSRDATSMSNLRKILIGNMTNTNPALAEYQDIIVSFINRHFSEDYFIATLAPIYAQQFTESELRQLVQFYGSPLGRKFVTVSPLIHSQASVQALSDLQQYAPELAQQLDQRMQEKARTPSHR